MALSIYSPSDPAAYYRTADDGISSSEASDALIGFLTADDSLPIPLGDLFGTAIDSGADNNIASTEFSDAIVSFLNSDDCPHFTLDDLLDNTVDSTAGHSIASSEISYDLTGFLYADDYPPFSIDDFLDTTADSTADCCIPSSEFADDMGFLSTDDYPLSTVDDPLDTTADNNLSSFPLHPDNDHFHCGANHHHNCSEFYFSTVPHTFPPPFQLPPFQLPPFQLPPFVPPPISSLPPPMTTEPSGVGGGSLSAQSVAARERRRKISDRTLALGRLVPGGGKMNTAEMLQAAQRYVKYLQAQIAILGLVTSEKVKSDAEEEFLQVMMASTVVQERLSKEGMCLVPIKMVNELALDPNMKLNPFIEKEMSKFNEALSKITK